MLYLSGNLRFLIFYFAIFENTKENIKCLFIVIYINICYYVYIYYIIYC